MTREQLIKHWNEIKAFKEGKEIEMRENGKDWSINKNPMFANEFEYRIKPEPKLIPFDFSDAEFLIGKAVKRKDGSKYVQLIHQVEVEYIFLGKGQIKFDHFLDSCIFLDGSACGKIKQ